jgi:hypothetical protein
MPRWFLALSLGASIAAGLACNDDTTEVVDKTVCYSEMRWVGEKRGSPEMFPGRDCVGCHIENDGPPLAIGGTIYPYVLGAGQPGLAAQTGTDCFGVEGITITITDADGQAFDLVTNRAGNFFVEGNPDDFAKPFNAVINWTNPTNDMPQTSPMNTAPMYGGCARCHDTAVPPNPMFDTDPVDADYVNGQPRIGLPNNPPQAELNLLGCQLDPSPAACARILMQAMGAGVQ